MTNFDWILLNNYAFGYYVVSIPTAALSNVIMSALVPNLSMVKSIISSYIMNERDIRINVMNLYV